MTALTLTLTHAGRAALVNADNTGTHAVSLAEIGLTQTAFNAAPTTTTLPGELKRLTTFSGAAVAADTVHISIRDDSSASYSLRGFGLYLDDGTLFAVYSQTAPIMQKSANAMLLLSVDIKLLQVAASSITFGNANFLNPPATTDVQGVVELATTAEAKAGTDGLRAITPAALKGVLQTHEQPWERITQTPDQATRWPKWSEVSEKPGTFTPAGHEHVIADVTGLQPALNNKLNLTGGTLTGALTVAGGVVSRAGDTYNPSVQLRNADNATRGLLLWNRGNTAVTLRRYNPETGQTQGELNITSTGNFTFSGALTAVAQLNLKATSTGHAGLWLRDDSNTGRGALNWNRDLDIVQLQRRNPEGGVQGELRIKGDGSMQIYGGPLTAPGFNGKATSADKLHTSPTINGTAFNGTANIITSRWGAERTLKIGTTGKAINGTGNVTWTLAEIGALPLTGGTLTGPLYINAGGQESLILMQRPQGQRSVYLTTDSFGNTGLYATGAHWLFRIDGGNNAAHFAGNIHATSAILNGSLEASSSVASKGGTNHNPVFYLRDVDGNACGNLHWNRASGQVYLVRHEPGTHNTAGWACINADNTFQTSHAISAPGFNGNASSADKLKTGRKLKIGATEQTFNGTTDLTWTPGQLGYSSSGGQNGWMKRPDGMIEQWGVYMQASTSETTRAVTFPISFPTACLNVTVSDVNPTGGNKIAYDLTAQVNQGSLTKTGFSVFIQCPSSKSSYNWAGMYWRAIGH